MPLRLTIFPPTEPGIPRVLADGYEYLAGRDTSADLVLDDSRVSREHVRIDGTRGGWRIEDLGSKNGIRVNGEPVHDAVLSARCWLSIGGLPVLAEPAFDAADLAAATERRHSQVTTLPRPDPDASVGAMLARALGTLREASDCERSGLWRVEGDGGLREVVALMPAHPPPSHGALRQALDSCRPIFCSDTAGAEALASRASIAGGGIRALVALPLAFDGQLLGVAYADSLLPGTLFTRLDADVLAGIADHMALTLAATTVHDAVAASTC